MASKLKRVTLDYEPRQWQSEVHGAKKRFNVLALHRRAGKTELAIMELIDDAIQCELEMAMFAYLAPFFNQAKTIAWARLKSRLAPLEEAGAVEIREGDSTVIFKHNGAIIRIFGGDKPDAMRGLRIDGIVIDEVAQIKAEVWYDIIQPATSDRHGWALFIGTPNGVNLFSQLYYKGLKDPAWQCSLWDVYSTEAIDVDEISRLRADMPPNSFNREYLCDFSAQSDDALMSLNEVMVSMDKMLTKEDVAGSAKILGVDVARYGGDRCCIFPRQGLIAYKPKIYLGIDNMTFAGHVADAINKWKPDMVCIDAGRGEGVIDRLRQLGHVIIEVNFGGKPMDTHYVNKRSEMWDAIRLWMERGGMLPDIEELKVDLCAPTYSYGNAQNKFQLESKDKLKARGLPSPDLADALALTFAYPSPPKAQLAFNGAVIDHGRGRKSTGDYDPLDRA